MLMISKLGVVSVLLACGAMSLLAMPSGHARRQPVIDQSIAARASSQIACASVGATPDSLAAAGLSAGEAGSLLRWLTSESPERAELMAAHQALADARSAIADRLAVGSEPRSGSSQQSTLTERTSQLRHAESRLAAARSALTAEADGVVGRPVCQVLLRMAEMARIGLPVEFGAAQLSPAEIRIARQALKAEARSAREGHALGAEHATALSAIRAQDAVLAAARARSANVAQMGDLMASVGLR